MIALLSLPPAALNFDDVRNEIKSAVPAMPMPTMPNMPTTVEAMKAAPPVTVTKPPAAATSFYERKAANKVGRCSKLTLA